MVDKSHLVNGEDLPAVSSTALDADNGVRKCSRLPAYNEAEETVEGVDGEEYPCTENAS